MRDIGIIYGLTTSRPPTIEQAKRRNRRERFLVILGVALFCLLMIILVLPGFQQAWQQARWDSAFWNDFFFMKVFILCLTTLAGIFDQTANSALRCNQRINGAETLPLRQAAAAGDDRLAPLAQDQPERLTTAESALHPEGESFEVRDITKGTRFTIHVDEQGIEWKTRRSWLPARRTRISWSEARAFYAFNYERRAGSAWNWEEAYVLDAPKQTLVWMLLLPWSRNTRQDQKETERLLRLIATYTGLPLRDLSETAEQLERLTSNTLADLPTQEQTTDTASVSSALGHLPRRVKPVKRQFLTYIGLTPIILMGLIAATAFGLQTYQRSSYTAMLPPIEAHQPLYHDALRAPDADWPTRLPSQDSSGSFTFKDNTYQLTGDLFMDALAPGTYGDVAVEVTARLYGSDAFDDYSGFGLLLHSDNPYLGIVFKIDAAGDWSIGLPSAESHQTGAIHQDFGASNRLAVIMRGQQYLCYINDQLVGIYENARSPTGPIGLYTEGGHTVAAFTDFIIYPL